MYVCVNLYVRANVCVCVRARARVCVNLHTPLYLSKSGCVFLSISLTVCLSVLNLQTKYLPICYMLNTVPTIVTKPQTINVIVLSQLYLSIMFTLFYGIPPPPSPQSTHHYF